MSNDPIPRKKSRTWLLVADRGTARVYNRATGSRRIPAAGPATRHVLEWRLDQVCEFGDETPNRAPVHAVAEWLNVAKAHKSFDHLFVAAPPQYLGELRPLLSRDTRDAVQMEIHKDLTHLPIPKLLDALSDQWPSLEVEPG
jgi:hypothetical protein